MSEIADAEKFLRDYGDDYLELLGVVVDVCKAAKRRSSSGIDDVYTRGTSQGGDKEFKAPAKIAAKLRQRGLSISVNNILLLNDIVGLTVVVQYYFATHIVCSSERAGQTLKCEIQFKTMLHDAWAAKMHDLTYKPQGMLDPSTTLAD